MRRSVGEGGVNMDESIASRLEEKLGADVFADLNLWMRGIVNTESATKDQYQDLSFRLEGLKDEVHWLRGELTGFRTEVNQRFDSFQASIDQRFDSFRADMDQRLDSINERFDTMNERILSNMKWSVGTIALFGTIITILMAIFKFV